MMPRSPKTNIGEGRYGPNKFAELQPSLLREFVDVVRVKHKEIGGNGEEEC
jgi:hypothetical protein